MICSVSCLTHDNQWPIVTMFWHGSAPFKPLFFTFLCIYVFCTEIAWISWDLRYVWNCLNSDSMIFPPRHSTSISSLRQSLACQVDDVWLLRYVLSFKDCWRLGCRDRMTFECKRIAENDFKSHSLITWLSIKEITWNFVVKAKHWIQEAFAEWVILATSKLLASFCDRRGRSDAVIGRCCPDQDDLPAAIHAAKAAITWRRERENFGRWSTLFVFFSFLCIMSYNGNLYYSLTLIVFILYWKNILVCFAFCRYDRWSNGS